MPLKSPSRDKKHAITSSPTTVYDTDLTAPGATMTSRKQFLVFF
jgi:hypothetical protein